MLNMARSSVFAYSRVRFTTSEVPIGGDLLGLRRSRGLPRHWLPRPVPGHAVEVDCVSVGHDVLIFRIVDVTVRVAGLRLLNRRRPSPGERLYSLPVLVARYSRLVRVLTLHAIRVHVTVLAAGHAVHADSLLLERAVVVLETPSDAAIRVVVPVSSQHL